MKKIGITAIVCAIAFFVFAITGGICIAIGSTQLAANEDVREFLLNLGGDIHSMMENAHESSNYSGTETYDLESQITTIELQGMTGDITVIPAATNTSTLTIEYDNIIDIADDDTAHFKFFLNGNTLTISPKNHLDSFAFNGFVSNSNCGDITIYLPQYTSLVVPTAYNLVITETVGEISISNCTFSNITLNSTVGEIEFDNITAQILTCTRTLGEINANGSFTGIIIEDTIGECEIESNTVLTVDSKIAGNIAEVIITLPDSQRLNVYTSSALGSIDIDSSLWDNTSDVNLDVTNSIGDITVKAD